LPAGLLVPSQSQSKSALTTDQAIMQAIRAAVTNHKSQITGAWRGHRHRRRSAAAGRPAHG
jgi:hypothetical protein